MTTDEIIIQASAHKSNAVCPDCGEQSVVVSVLNRDKRMTCIECPWNSLKD